MWGVAGLGFKGGGCCAQVQYDLGLESKDFVPVLYANEASWAQELLKFGPTLLIIGYCPLPDRPPLPRRPPRRWAWPSSCKARAPKEGNES